MAELNSDGDLQVWQRLRLPRATSTLRLHLTDPTGVQGIVGLHPVADDLQVQAGSSPVVAPDAVRVGTTAILTLPAGATTVLLGYRLTGVTTRSAPSPVGRALVVLTPLLADAGDTATPLGPMVLAITGDGVLGVVCPLRVRRPLCATGGGGRFVTAALTPADAVAVGQVDLPAPGGLG